MGVKRIVCEVFQCGNLKTDTTFRDLKVLIGSQEYKWCEFQRKYFCVIYHVAADHINTDIRTAV